LAVCTDEEVVVGLWDEPDEGASRAEVSSQLARERRVEGSPAGSALRLGDEQHPTAKIDVPDPEAQRLSKPKACAVQNQQ
jgi:hypothetical protein